MKSAKAPLFLDTLYFHYVSVVDLFINQLKFMVEQMVFMIWGT